MTKYNQYIEDVTNQQVTNNLVTCKWVKLAVQRHLKDLKDPEIKKEFFFDEEAADRVIAFNEQLKHFKGEWAGS